MSGAGQPTLRRLLRLRWGLAASGILLLIVASAALAPWISPRPSGRRHPSPTGASRLDGGGTTEHLLGTDPVGRDLLSRMIYGGRVSLVSG